MDTTSIELLCTGDLHLGRHPTRIPESVDGSEYSPRSVWQDTVRTAINRDVDVVVITGDVADRENRYFEAYGAFEAGVISLDEAGIPVVTVAGNHDSEFLPRMVDDIGLENLHLLGENGTWGRWSFEKGGETAAHFEGWSFPQQHVATSPLEEYDLEGRDAPQIGVLHTELDSPRSQYAPVSSTDLQETPVACWLLGHIHMPGVQREAEPFALYPGSPQALDPGEPGVHGPWVVSVDADGTVDADQVPLGTVCYDEVPVDVSDVEDVHAAGAAASEAIREHLREDLDTQSMELFLPRVRLTGRSDVHGELVEGSVELGEQLAMSYDSVSVQIESVRVETRPAVDLAELADGDGPVSYLATLLLELNGGESEGKEYTRLVDGAHDELQEAYRENAFDLLRQEGIADPPEREDAVEVLEQEARRLLDALLQQKEGSV